MGSVARKDSYKQAAQARRLLNNVSVAPHVLAGTVVDEYFPAEQSVSYRIASEDFDAGALHISRHQGYYLIECKVAPGRYYVIIRVAGEWKCSIANDERLLAKLMMKVIEYRTVPMATYIDIATGATHTVSKTVGGYIIDEVA